jgi:hypothetical protein
MKHRIQFIFVALSTEQTKPTIMPRAIHLVVYNSPLFPAHWGLWIPSAADPKVGKFIHATGDAAKGFEISFERNYNISVTRRRHQILPIAQVLDQHVLDVVGDGSRSSDQTAHDYIEQVALSVPAPARSLTSASSQVSDIYLWERFC